MRKTFNTNGLRQINARASGARFAGLYPLLAMEVAICIALAIFIVKSENLKNYQNRSYPIVERFHVKRSLPGLVFHDYWTTNLSYVRFVGGCGTNRFGVAVWRDDWRYWVVTNLHTKITTNHVK